MKNGTKFQRILYWFENHPVFSWLLVLCVFLGGAGTLTGAIDNLVSFSKKYFFSDTPPVVPLKVHNMLPIPKAGFGYHYYVPDGTRLDTPDSLDHGTTSQIQLFEDTTLLGPGHSSHEEIRTLGGGRYSHWRDDWGNEYVYFSTSDNSDPRTNHKRYHVEARGISKSLNLDPSDLVKVFEETPPCVGLQYNVSTLSISPPDTHELPKASSLLLFENATQVGPPHSAFRAIQRLGHGRYRHIENGGGTWLYFSTSDNSNPRENTRSYVLTTSSSSEKHALVPGNIIPMGCQGDYTFAYRYPMAGQNLGPPDTVTRPTESKLLVLENGKPLPYPHSDINDIKNSGKGLYRHYQDGSGEWLFFSTPDNSDPRKNGRT